MGEKTKAEAEAAARAEAEAARAEAKVKADAEAEAEAAAKAEAEAEAAAKGVAAASEAEADPAALSSSTEVPEGPPSGTDIEAAAALDDSVMDGYKPLVMPDATDPLAHLRTGDTVADTYLMPPPNMNRSVAERPPPIDYE